MSIAKRLFARTVLAKVYANDKQARRFYSPLPQTPYGPSAASDWRKVSRPCPPEFMKGLVHYELAVEHDVERIMDFVVENILPNQPFLNLMGVNPNEVIDFYAPIVNRSLKGRCSLLGFVGDELVAISLHSVVDVHPDPNSRFTKAEIIPTKNYASDIDSAPFKNRTASKLFVFMEQLRHRFQDLIPNARKVMFIELGGVADKYRGRGISKEMVELSLQLAREQFHCDHVVTIGDSKPSQKLLCQKLDFKLLREFKLDHFLDGEVPAFPEEADGVTSGKLLSVTV